MENPKSIEYVDLNPVRDIFNWTMTYRSDSDVYVPYGRTVDHGTKPAATKRDMKALWKTKSRTAVWLISDCLSYSGRKNFSRELQQYMDVDVYGKCGPRDFPKTGVNASYEHFERNYHFILTFEDSICAEYVTEKLFTALKYDIVPVVFGGANYSRIAPRHFYIDAFAFESFEKLAEYLVALSRNYTEYVAYFKWKESHSVEPLKSGYCELCTKLHSDPTVRRSSSYQDIKAWWLEQKRCRL
ncbi:alpha-(1,3)-fucosyltransferase C [Rhipicephalus sanguineus]|uniref:alpha-(1,3)-fucosyltransferase C n=1 Tax=Rhipicephalus sanguineus TaxID=34632 RepID=UPI001895B8D8|nr:alpha-(1,3)-fucosyltransferase C [Rhipicephalus sanguineus]